MSAKQATPPCFSDSQAPARPPPPTRIALVGDDEHGWTRAPVFNLEGGCYAKTIDLSQLNEPVIWDAIRFGAIIEKNVTLDADRRANYSDTSLTENGRCCYPLEHVPKRTLTNAGASPVRDIPHLRCLGRIATHLDSQSKEAAAFHSSAAIPPA